MVQARRAYGLRETSEQVVAHGDLVVSLNRTRLDGHDDDAGSPVVAVFRFDGDRVSEFWGFAG